MDFLGRLFGGQQQAGPALGQAMNPTAVQQGAQPGLGMMLQKLQQNPAAIQALLNTGAQLLNPTSFGSPGGRIASAVASGVQDYSTAAAAADDKAYQRGREAKADKRADRSLDIQEEGVDVQRDSVGVRKEGLGIERDKLAAQNEQWLKNFGLEQEKLNQQKGLWEAQAERYSAEALRLRQKAESGAPENLTGPERVMNRIAEVLKNQAGMDSDMAFIKSFDIYNKAGQDEAKAISSVVESLGFLGNTEKGQKMLSGIINEIKDTFKTGEDLVNEASLQNGGGDAAGAGAEVAPGVTQSDIEMALSASNANSGTNLTWEQLTPPQREMLVRQIKAYKQGTQ